MGDTRFDLLEGRLSGAPGDGQWAHASLEALVHASPEPIMALDEAGRVTLWNPAAERVFGWPEAEALGRYNPIVPPEKREEFDGLRGRVLAGESFQGVEVQRQRRDGSTVHVSVSTAPLRGDGGRVTGVMALVRDVTERHRRDAALADERERLEARVAERTRHLRAANEELEAFAFRVSHDIQRHLRAVDFFGEVLEEDHGPALDDGGRESLRRLREGVGHLSQLVSDLLALSRAGLHALIRRPVDLSALARDVVVGLRERHPDRPVEVTVQEGVGATGDPRLLRIVLENLLGNAWKYTAREPVARVEFGAEPVEDGDGDGAGDTRVFFVRDNGAGFDPGEAHRLYQPFQRLTTEGEFEGTGVGLATVKRIVERHGGRAWAESAGPGEGATFWFTVGE